MRVWLCALLNCVNFMRRVRCLQETKTAAVHFVKFYMGVWELIEGTGT